MFDAETLLAGAWRRRRDQSVLMMLINVGDTEQEARFAFDWEAAHAAYDGAPARLRAGTGPFAGFRRDSLPTAAAYLRRIACAAGNEMRNTAWTYAWLALTVGGTKTDAVLCAGDGTVLSRKIGDASSPTSRTLEEAEGCILDILEELLSPYGGLNARIDGLYAGISGGGLARNRGALHRCFTSKLPNVRNLGNGSDSVNAISCVLAHGDGIVAIAGTGTSVFARRDGVMHQVGGWGYLLGDEGSGFDMGRMALQAVFTRAGRAGKAHRADPGMCAKTGVSPFGKRSRGSIRGDGPLIASFAPCLIETAESGDEVAADLCHQAARSLYEAILAARRWLDMSVCPVVMAGSVWQAGGYFEKKIGDWLGDDFILMRAEQPPVYGAVAEAARLANIPVDAEFQKRFSDTMKAGGK